MNPARIKILVVDDEQGLCAGLQEGLRREGYQVDAATSATEALRLAGQNLYNLVISDVKMPGAGGLELLAQIHERSRDTLFILMTAFGTVENAVEAMRLGAYDYLAKPIDLKRLRLQVQKALDYQTVVAENHELRSRLQKQSEPNPLIGESECMRAVARLIEEVAQSEVTALIEGESGTGKEIAARLIHTRSRRQDRPFISVNCAAFAEPLLEAELFGHVKGAFTGAAARKAGRFQMADGGTLFLDEIGDLSPKGQGDLLRVLEDGTFRMVGGSELIRVDVRIIAATNKKLPASVAEGTFREDLLYRLNVVPIEMPPLRERREDIPLLIEHFFARLAARHKRGCKQMSPEAMRLCQRFPWPGNVRQLRNAVERIVITCRSGTAGLADLPDFLREFDRPQATFAVHPGATLAEVEKLLIRQTLSLVTSNREAAAKTLGISRRTLQYKLKQYGLLEPRADAPALALQSSAAKATVDQPEKIQAPHAEPTVEV